MKKLHLTIGGMTCLGCETIIERKLIKIEGVDSAKASLSTKELIVECSDDVNVEDLKEALKGTQYDLHDEEENVVELEEISNGESQTEKQMSEKSKKLRINVGGMTCSACEVIIERKLAKVDGVDSVKANQSKGEIVCTCSEDVDVEDLRKALNGTHYVLHDNNAKLTVESKNSSKDSYKDPHKRNFAEIGAFVLIIAGVYFLLKRLDLLPNIGVSDQMSYGFVFLIGLVAAASTCLAVSGGLLLAIAAKYNETHQNLSGWQRFKPHIYFNAGRIISYTLLGGIIGLIGSAILISPLVTGIITILASLLMIIVGLQLLHIFPSLGKFQPKMPKFIAHKIYDKSQSQNQGEGSSFIFGALTFFLPCGFTQALQLYVLSRGDFFIGSLTMLVFALGTLPSLAGIGLISSLSKGNFLRHFTTFAAVLVVILGIFTLPSGLSLMGSSFSFDTNSINGNNLDNGNGANLDGLVKIVDGKQIVDMKVIGLEYSPSNFKIQKGIPVVWNIDGSKAQGCAQVITIPKLGITESLPRTGVKTINFVPQDVGKISFSCTMGMTTAGAGFNVVEGA